MPSPWLAAKLVEIKFTLWVGLKLGNLQSATGYDLTQDAAASCKVQYSYIQRLILDFLTVTITCMQSCQVASWSMMGLVCYTAALSVQALLVRVNLQDPLMTNDNYLFLRPDIDPSASSGESSAASHCPFGGEFPGQQAKVKNKTMHMSAPT